jgi:hypothetical protein
MCFGSKKSTPPPPPVDNGTLSWTPVPKDVPATGPEAKAPTDTSDTNQVSKTNSLSSTSTNLTSVAGGSTGTYSGLAI